MTQQRKAPRRSDRDNGEWSAADFRHARPVAAVLPAIIAAAKRARGRPKLARPKAHITLRLDADVVDAFKADGPGWQTRINDALSRAVKRRRRDIGKKAIVARFKAFARNHRLGRPGSKALRNEGRL
jgi:uncharacterized protein (DUF4415 family)